MIRRSLAAALVGAALAPGAAAACDAGPPQSIGLVVEVCTGTATITGPGTFADGVYRDDDPARLPDVRIAGGGGEASVYVGRLDREGVLMDGAVGPERLAAGVEHRLALFFEHLLLERGGGRDVGFGPVDARRVFRSPRTPLSDAAAARASSACFAFRGAVPAPFRAVGSAEFILRTLRLLRRGRERLTRHLAAAPETELDGRYVAPVVASLRRGNGYLRSVDRRWRGRRGGISRLIRAYARGLPREERLRRRLGLSECEADQPFAAAS